MTDAQGNYQLLQVTFGEKYHIKAEAVGFVTLSKTITPQSGLENRLDFTLEALQICRAGNKRCLSGGSEGVETCNSSGSGWQATMCAAGEVCQAGAEVSCIRGQTIKISTSGEGAVRSSPAGLNCNPTCEKVFPSGTQVVLTAVPFTHAEFLGWGGACSGMESSCSVVADKMVEVEARFRATKYELKVSKTSSGLGRVSSMPMGILCDPDCDAFFDRDSTVRLTAEPSQGYLFSRWEGDCSGSNRTCEVTMSKDRSVRARFQRPGPVLQVSKEGQGNGRVTSMPSGIDCGSECESNFNNNTEVTLTASAAPGSGFEGWGGDCMGTDLTCTIRVNQARMVSARFSPNYLFPLPADGSCLVGLSLDDQMGLEQKCGGGRAAQLRGNFRSVMSRSVALAQALEPADSMPGAIDTRKRVESSNGLTIEMTVQRSGAAFAGDGRAVLYSDFDSSVPNAGIRVMVNDQGRVWVSSYSPMGTTTASSAEGLLREGQWAHLAVELDSSQMAIYLDGQREVSQAEAVRWTASSSTAWFGAQREGGAAHHRFNGIIDEVRISGRRRHR